MVQNVIEEEGRENVAVDDAPLHAAALLLDARRRCVDVIDALGAPESLGGGRGARPDPRQDALVVRKLRPHAHVTAHQQLLVTHVVDVQVRHCNNNISASSVNQQAINSNNFESHVLLFVCNMYST